MATTKTSAKKTVKATPKKSPVKKAVAKKAPTKKVAINEAAAAAGAHEESTVDMALSIRGMIQPEAAGASAGDMSPAERDKTRDWFAETRGALGAHMTAVGKQIFMASSGPRKDGLTKIKGSLLSDQQILDRREEAFFAEDSTQTMQPPSDADVARTRDLSAKLGSAIAEQQSVEAIVDLVNDLSSLVLKVSNPG